MLERTQLCLSGMTRNSDFLFTTCHTFAIEGKQKKKLQGPGVLPKPFHFPLLHLRIQISYLSKYSPKGTAKRQRTLLAQGARNGDPMQFEARKMLINIAELRFTSPVLLLVLVLGSPVRLDNQEDLLPDERAVFVVDDLALPPHPVRQALDLHQHVHVFPDDHRAPGPQDPVHLQEDAVHLTPCKSQAENQQATHTQNASVHSPCVFLPA
jgi:hypothetical protein